MCNTSKSPHKCIFCYIHILSCCCSEQWSVAPPAVAFRWVTIALKIFNEVMKQPVILHPMFSPVIWRTRNILVHHLRPTGAIISLSNQHLANPDLWERWIIFETEICSLIDRIQNNIWEGKNALLCIYKKSWISEFSSWKMGEKKKKTVARWYFCWACYKSKAKLTSGSSWCDRRSDRTSYSSPYDWWRQIAHILNNGGESN